MANTEKIMKVAGAVIGLACLAPLAVSAFSPSTPQGFLIPLAAMAGMAGGAYCMHLHKSDELPKRVTAYVKLP